MTGILVRKENLDDTHTEERRCIEMGRKQPSRSQGERCGTHPSVIASEGTNPADILILDF